MNTPDPKGTTFWDFLLICFNWLEGRTTRILGVASGTLAILTGGNIIPDKDLKYYVIAIAVLTYWRGQSTSNTYQQAKTVLSEARIPSPVTIVNPVEIK